MLVAVFASVINTSNKRQAFFHSPNTWSPYSSIEHRKKRNNNTVEFIMQPFMSQVCYFTLKIQFSDFFSSLLVFVSSLFQHVSGFISLNMLVCYHVDIPTNLKRQFIFSHKKNIYYKHFMNNVVDVSIALLFTQKRTENNRLENLRKSHMDWFTPKLLEPNVAWIKIAWIETHWNEVYTTQWRVSYFISDLI